MSGRFTMFDVNEHGRDRLSATCTTCRLLVMLGPAPRLSRAVSFTWLVLLFGTLAPESPAQDARLAPNLADLVRYVGEQEALGHKLGEFPLPPNVVVDGERRVRVVIAVTALTDDAREALKARDVLIETYAADAHLVQARVPLGRLYEVSGLPFVRLIRLPSYGRTNAQGSVATEGEALVRADAARESFGVDGSGIRVGVISDGIAIVTLSASTGNLPPTQLIRDETGLVVASEGGVTGRSFRVDEALQGPLGLPLAEGTAMLEIVHDVAPGAQLFFASISTDVEFVNAVKWLTEEAGGPNARRGTTGGVDVIINDFVFLDLGPLDGTNSAAQAATNAANQGVVVVTAVGNSAGEHYRGVFSDPDGNHFHNFAPGDEGIRVTVPGQSELTVFLRWDDPWNTSTNDYDLRLFDTAGNPVEAFGGTSRQTGVGPPVEILGLSNRSGLPRTVDVRVENFEGRAAPRTLNMLVMGGATPIDHNVPLGSVVSPADARGVISVGAVPASAPEAIEPFSGQGPTLDGRLKPELVAPDRVSTTIFGAKTFIGTSAAAPHVGAVAALLLGLDPTLTPEKVQRALEVSAKDLGSPGPDQAFGFGLVDAVAALGLPRADIALNASTYATGDTLVLDLLARMGLTLNRGDAYLVALIPTGEFVSLVLQADGRLQLVNGLVPVQRGFSVLNLDGPVYERAFLPTDPRGKYVVFGVLVLEGRDPMDQNSWIVFDIEEYTLGG